MIYNPACRRCGLWQGKRSVCVPGEGSLYSEVLVLGEAPGQTEDKENRPFVGRSGKLLRSALEEVGFPDVRIENPVRCQPPKNRTPRSSELEACRLYTVQLVERMPNLKLIVALGNVPLKEVTNQQNVLKRAGTPELHEYLGRNFTVMPCVHPSYCMRKPGYLPKFIGDLRAALKVLRGEHAGDDLYRLAEGRAAVREIKRFTASKRPVAFDFETTDLYPWRGQILRVSFYNGRGKAVSCAWDSPDVVRAFMDFATSSVEKIVQNVKMESGWCETHLGVPLRNVIADTQIMSKREDEERPASLAVIVSVHVPELIGFKIDSEQALTEGEEWWTVDAKVLGMRNALDSLATWRAWKRMAEILGPDQMEAHLSMDLPIAKAVGRLTTVGLAFDRDRMLEMRETYLDQAREAESRFRQLGFESSLASPQQLARELKENGIDTRAWNPSGAMSTDNGALAGVIRAVAENPKDEDGNDLSWAAETCQHILDYRRAMKVVSTYIVGYGRHMRNGLIHSSFRFPGTETWRLSSSDPNLQNIPRADKGPFRDCVVSRHKRGWLVEVDYSQAELRVLAALSQDPYMLDIYRTGGDIHAATAEAIWGPGWTKEQRSLAKPVNFGRVYGGDANTMMGELEKDEIYLPLSECQRFLTAWNNKYPVAGAYMDDLRWNAQQDLRVEAPFGHVVRHLTVGTRGLSHVAKSGANFPLQFAAAMMTNIALALCDPANEYPGFSLDPDLGVIVLCTHDSLMADCRTKSNAIRVGRHIRRVMLHVAKEQPWLRVPMEADIKVGRSWLSAVEL